MLNTLFLADFFRQKVLKIRRSESNDFIVRISSEWFLYFRNSFS